MEKSFQNYRFRPHAIGHIMGGVPKPLTAKQFATYQDLKDRFNGNGKPLTEKQAQTFGDLSSKYNAKCTLTDASKKYLDRLVWEDITGRSSHISAKYLDKGIRVEEKSFSLYSDVTGKLFLNNKERKQNDFFDGECDNAQGGVIRDIKSSWSFESFPLTENSISNKLYEWQLYSYMDLYECETSELIYCLVDTPTDLIEDELRRLDWKHHISNHAGDIKEEHIPLVVEMISNHIYSFKGLEDFCNQSSSVHLKWFENFREIPEQMRVKIFKQDYDQNKVSQLKEMIFLARDYMDQVYSGIKATILENV